MAESNKPVDRQSIQELIAESRRLSQDADAIRRRMDDLAEQLAVHAEELERLRKNAKGSAPSDHKPPLNL